MTDIYEKNESGQGFAAQIARQFHIPRWEQLPSIDLYMDQLLVYIANSLGAYFACTGTAGLTKSMVNNYVKMGAVPPPVKKKYSKAHIAHLLIICFLKQILPISMICEIIRTYLGVYSESEMLNAFSSEYEQILRTALEMLMEEGYESIRITTVAERLGCSTQPISWQFGGMEGFRAALAAEAVAYASLCWRAVRHCAKPIFSARERGRGACPGAGQRAFAGSEGALKRIRRQRSLLRDWEEEK